MSTFWDPKSLASMRHLRQNWIKVYRKEGCPTHFKIIFRQKIGSQRGEGAQQVKKKLSATTMIPFCSRKSCISGGLGNLQLPVSSRGWEGRMAKAINCEWLDQPPPPPTHNQPENCNASFNLGASSWSWSWSRNSLENNTLGNLCRSLVFSPHIAIVISVTNKTAWPRSGS